MKFYTRSAQTLLRHRPARPPDVPVHPGCGRQGVLLAQPGVQPEAFLAAIKPFRDDLVVAVECMFAWYWVADLCARGGHRLRAGARAVHGGHPRGQGQERQDRRPQDRRAAQRRDAGAGLCVSAPDARHPGPAAPQVSPDAQALGAHHPHPEHHQPVQPAALRGPASASAASARGCSRTSPIPRCATPSPWIWP